MCPQRWTGKIQLVVVLLGLVSQKRTRTMQLVVVLLPKLVLLSQKRTLVLVLAFVV